MLSTPEWLRDPTGRHVRRYWDGAQWSEGVDDGTGTTLSDPLPAQPPPPGAVAQWYRDPCGRHALRFWDGVQWTPTVSDGGATTADAVAVDPATPPPTATVAGWYADPAGRWAMRFWETDHWSVIVSNGRTYENADPDPAWLPPQGPRVTGPRPQGFRSARRAGWHLGATLTLKAQGRDRCPRCGHALTVTEVARPGETIDYTPDTTTESYPPCAGCGAVPPWSTPAGLHPDPTSRHQFRYWDGHQWTDRVADAGVGSSDPLGVAA